MERYSEYKCTNLMIGGCYYVLGQYYLSNEFLTKAYPSRMKYNCDAHNIPYSEIITYAKKKKFKDELLGAIFYQMSLNDAKLNDTSSMLKNMSLGAIFGDKSAISYCNQIGYDYIKGRFIY